MADPLDDARSRVGTADERFRLAFDDAPIAMGLVRLDDDGLPVWDLVNDQMGVLLGEGRERLEGTGVSAATHPADAAADRRQMEVLLGGGRARSRRELRVVRPDGGVVWVRRTVAVVSAPGGATVAVAHLEDVTLRRAADAELQRRALRDPLTDLPNRDHLTDRLREALARAEDEPGVVVVLFVDLDRFKDVNDTLGHEAGDEVLQEVARRLSGCVRSQDTAARLAGDEFVLVVHLDDAAGASALAERVYTAVREPMTVAGRELQVVPSIGVATADGRTPTTAEDLLREADLAMYQAKRHGPRPWEQYDQALHRRSQERLAVEAVLRAALERGWLRLLYQPVVDLRTRAVVGAEALLRIEHPERGTLLPASFIDVAETSDLVVPIGAWVLHEACRQLAAWRGSWPDVHVSVNVSARQAQRLAVAGQVDDALTGSDAPAAGLVLEITESALLQAGELVAAELAAVTGAGCGLSIDDFGTGYSSLTHLKRFPVTEVKIDRSFVDGLGTDAGDTAIVTAVTTLGHSLGLGVVAEGIETEGQLAELVRLGCERGQGYLFGRPMAAAELEGLLRRGHGDAVA